MDTTSIIALDSKTFISGNEDGNIVLWRHCWYFVFYIEFSYLFIKQIKT
jgi:hypothetical protein